MYTLVANEANQLFLEIWCGGLALQERVLTLSSDDVLEYERLGKVYLDRLALLVCRKPGYFEERTSAESTRPLSPKG